MSTFASYRHDVRTRPDTTWDLYLNFLYPTSKQRASIKIRRVGFTLRTVNQNDDAAPDRQFGAQVFRLDIPSYDNIDNVIPPLFDAAAEAGGKYDGWESPAISARS